MANKYMDSTLLDKAIIFAVKAHANTERRGKGFPYIVHPLEAIEIVATITSDQEMLAAAALHDVVEDTEVCIDDIKKEFGERVASLVASESEKPVIGKSETDSWRERKLAAINRLENSSRDAKIIALGDKLSNMRAIYHDYMELGDKLWDRFHAPGGKPDHEWHYRGLARALCELAGTFAFSEFTHLLTQVFGEPKPEKINLDNYEQSGDGFTAISYNHKDGKSMIKLYAEYIPLETPITELYTSWNIMDLGLNIPKAYSLVTDGIRIGVEFERITQKQSFARAISNNPERLEFYAKEFAKECKKLHSTPCRKQNFQSIKKKFHHLVNDATFLTKEEKSKAHNFINSTPDAITCCHGDIHIGNIITDEKKNYWIDLADFAYGDPKFDLGMFWFVTHIDDEDLTQKLYHISCAQMLRVWEIFVMEYYGAHNKAEIHEIDKIIKPYASFYFLLFIQRGTEEPFMKDFVKENICR